MRRKFIGGNWKMNGKQAELSALLKAIITNTKSLTDLEIAIFPSDVYVAFMQSIVKNSAIQIGGQNCSDHEMGAYTGETSVAMLKELGCHYVLLGHSERRHLFGETNHVIARKFAIAKHYQVQPILCVGETETQRDMAETDAVVREQLSAVINEVGINALAGTLIAYEPVWAIGTGKVASPDEVQAMHAMIREHLARSSEAISKEIRIIYGGSVKPINAEAIFAQPDVDGGLIGGASLNADDFTALCQLLNDFRLKPF